MTELEIISYSQRQQRGRDSEWARLERKRLRSRAWDMVIWMAIWALVAFAAIEVVLR